MSHSIQDQFNLSYPPVGGPRTGQLPQPGQYHSAQGKSDFIDGSGPLFQMYLETAAEEDRRTTDSWKADADGILIFTGLFSAAVAAFTSVSLQDLRPNAQDVSAFYLAQIYHLFATDSNGSLVLIPPLPAAPPTFSPPIYAVWVNSLWFLSLLISLTCALLATLLQQWARRYMRPTQKRYSLHKRARIRAFFTEGVEELQLPSVVEALPALLHLSLFLFFVGLAVFLFNINHTVFNVAMSWIGICTGIYIYITFMPMVRHDSPYYAPLSLSAWYLYNGTLCTVMGTFKWIADRFNFISASAYNRVVDLGKTYQQRIVRGMEKEIEETALGRSSELYGRALAWTFESLDEEHELEQFFAGIPGFCGSKVVESPQSILAGLKTVELRDALLGFWRRTLSSNLVSAPIKERRFVICVRVIDALHLSHVARSILDTFLEPQHAQFLSVEIWPSLITQDDNDDRGIASVAQGIIALIIANTQRDQRWFELTMHHLRIPEHTLRGYLNHGDSLLLANLIHLIRQLLLNFENPESVEVAMKILPELSRFLAVQDSETLPELQHDFCRLWNDIVLEARTNRLLHILRPIRFIYLALHQRTNAAPTAFSASTPDSDSILFQVSSYPRCNITSHRVDPAFNPSEVDDGRTMETARAFITTSPAVPRCDAGPSAISFIANTPSSSTPSLDHTNPQPVDEPSRNEVPRTLQRTTPAASSSHPASLENDGAAAGPVQSMAGPSLGSSMADVVPRSASSRDADSPGIQNTIIIIPPSSNPDPVPSPPSLYGELELPPSSQFTTSSLFASHIKSNLDSNAMTEIGPLDVPHDTLGPNYRIVSQSPTSSSPYIAEDDLRREDRDPSENV